MRKGPESAENSYSIVHLARKLFQYPIDFALTHPAENCDPFQLLSSGARVSGFPAIYRLGGDIKKRPDGIGCQSEPLS